ncbi:MAG: S16 family serine protease [Roseibacillus sp.]
MKRTFYTAVAVGAALILTGLSTSLRAQGENDIFYLPDMDAEIFDTKKLDFGRRGEIDKSGLVAALARVASDFDEENGEVDNDLRSNALGISGRINPNARSFKTTYEQLKENAKAWGAGNTSKERLVGNIYSGVRTLMKKDSEDNRTCAAYCIDVALRLVPGHKYGDKLADLRDKLKADGVQVDWKKMKGAAVLEDLPWSPFGQRGRMEPRSETMPPGPAEKLAVNQSSVVGLVVVTLSGGKHAGAASEIIATALRESNTKGVEFKIDQKVGDMMGNSLKSIKDYLRVIYEPKDMVPDGYVVNIVFQDRDQRVDGPSAGTAMALMLDALFTGEKIDEDFACTGGITPNGKTTKIGGVAAKIRGATRRKCKIVGVPEGNANGVNDILVLDGIQQLLDIQVFTMKDMDQARELSRAEKNENVQSTLDDFNAVAEVIADQGEKMLKNSNVQSKLEAVVKKMPNHISAQLLLDFAKGKAPEQLSVGGSFQEIDSRSSAAFSAVQMMVMRKKVHEGKAARREAKDALEELNAIDGKVHEAFEKYLKGATELCEVLEAGIEDGEDEFLKELKKKWDAVQAERKKLSEDPKIREEIMG